MGVPIEVAGGISIRSGRFTPPTRTRQLLSVMNAMLVTSDTVTNPTLRRPISKPNGMQIGGIYQGYEVGSEPQVYSRLVHNDLQAMA